MGTFLDQAQLLENTDFIKRIKIAVKKNGYKCSGRNF